MATKRIKDRVWRLGSRPKEPGWYYASINRRPRYVRWFDGEQWFRAVRVPTKLLTIPAVTKPAAFDNSRMWWSEIRPASLFN